MDGQQYCYFGNLYEYSEDSDHHNLLVGKNEISKSISKSKNGLEMYRFSCYFRSLKMPSIKIIDEHGSKGLYINIPFIEIIIGLNKYDHGCEFFRLISW